MSSLNERQALAMVADSRNLITLAVVFLGSHTTWLTVLHLLITFFKYYIHIFCMYTACVLAVFAYTVLYVQ